MASYQSYQLHALHHEFKTFLYTKCLLSQTCHTREPQRVSQYNQASHYIGWVSPITTPPRPRHLETLASRWPEPARIQPTQASWCLGPLGINGSFLPGLLGGPNSALSFHSAATSLCPTPVHKDHRELPSPGLAPPGLPATASTYPNAILPVRFSREPTSPVGSVWSNPSSSREPVHKSLLCATAFCQSGRSWQNLPLLALPSTAALTVDQR